MRAGVFACLLSKKWNWMMWELGILTASSSMDYANVRGNDVG